MSSRGGGLRWSWRRTRGRPGSPSRRPPRLRRRPAAFGGLTGMLLPEHLGEHRGLAVAGIVGRGEQRDWAGGRQRTQVIQRLSGVRPGPVPPCSGGRTHQISPGHGHTRCEVRWTAPRPWPIRRTGPRPCGARAARSGPPGRAFRPGAPAPRTPGEPGRLAASRDPPLPFAYCHHATGQAGRCPRAARTRRRGGSRARATAGSRVGPRLRPEGEQAADPALEPAELGADLGGVRVVEVFQDHE